MTAWLAPLVVVGALFLPAYNLELLGGRLHGDLWFALGWGAFPAFVGYFVNAERVALPGLLGAGACLALSVAQRRLSTPARELRRRTSAVGGVRERSDGSTEALSRATLLEPLDGALAALSLGVVVLACAPWPRVCERSESGAVGGPARGHVLLVLPALAANLDRDVDEDDVDEQADPAERGDQADVLRDGLAGGEDHRGESHRAKPSNESSAGVVALGRSPCRRAPGEVPERLNGHDWKSCDGGNLVRGFESLPLRPCCAQ